MYWAEIKVVGGEKSGRGKGKEQPGMGNYWAKYLELIVKVDCGLGLIHRWQKHCYVFCSIYSILGYVA